MTESVLPRRRRGHTVHWVVGRRRLSVLVGLGVASWGVMFGLGWLWGTQERPRPPLSADSAAAPSEPEEASERPAATGDADAIGSAVTEAPGGSAIEGVQGSGLDPVGFGHEGAEGPAIRGAGRPAAEVASADSAIEAAPSPGEVAAPSQTPTYATRAPRGGVGLQVAAYQSLEEAEAFLRAHSDALVKPGPVYVLERRVRGEVWYRVRVGAFATPAQAERARERLPADLGAGAMVVRHR